MNSLIIFLALAIFISPGYLVWPSRYNIIAHLSLGGNFISTFVPAIILGVHNNFAEAVVDLYSNILLVGAISFAIGLFVGYRSKPDLKRFSYEVLDSEVYLARVMSFTKWLMIVSIVMLVLSYAGMGFIPAFAADPFLAKFFRGPYQAPYMRVAIFFRTSFYILSTIIPISAVIWYQTKRSFFLYSTILAVALMALSLSRSPAFSGLVLAFGIIMVFKSRFHFILLLLSVIGLYVFSSVFYFIIGARELDYSNYNTEHPYWEIIASGSPDIADQLLFMEKFVQHPNLTYGQTIYGGLIPGHYEWNPGVYTLKVLTNGDDLEEIVSGGLRLPAPIWGYVSFGWFGIIGFCLISGYFYGYFTKYLKKKLMGSDSLIIKTIIIVSFNVVFANFYTFYTLSIYLLPPTFVMLFYLYRFKID
ncbi:O-antigen polymerase [Pedobacter sp. BMA]|uniref:O-antigen polymerase n=1 Tax=Pedobacter sp. BMA TaxID=1663685 RepID=UPI00064A4FA5|nr:O-antigen polymerase [Pedobacter sp. BMA]KLT64011.1 hypothetical protein AB669_18260 [Pedobacter sp. BMA]